MTRSFTLVTRTPQAVADLFDVSLSIDHTSRAMGEWGARPVAGVTSGTIGLGETVTWCGRHFGIWFRHTSQITELERPARFTDEMIRGPFASFRHQHLFHREGDTTVMTDVVTLKSPILGAIVEPCFLVPYFRHLLRVRNRYLLAVLAAAPTPQ